MQNADTSIKNCKMQFYNINIRFDNKKNNMRSVYKGMYEKTPHDRLATQEQNRQKQ